MHNEVQGGASPRPQVPIDSVPTCRQLAAQLEKFGDRPLLSGRTWFAITGFAIRQDGRVSTRAMEVEHWDDSTEVLA